MRWLRNSAARTDDAGVIGLMPHKHEVSARVYCGITGYSVSSAAFCQINGLVGALEQFSGIVAILGDRGDADAGGHFYGAFFELEMVLFDRASDKFGKTLRFGFRVAGQQGDKFFTAVAAQNTLID